MKKKARVHKLATEEASRLCEHIRTTGRKLHYFIAPEKSHAWRPQHLYITTDEEIKKGDWAYSNGKVMFINSAWKNFKGDAVYKKIIATTDPKLINEKEEGFLCSDIICDIPKIPQSFIEEYCKAGGIDEVLVEYEAFESKHCNCRCHHPSHRDKVKHIIACCNPTVSKRPNLNNNCIIIHPVEEKMYSLGDMIKAYHMGYADRDAKINPFSGQVPKKWIEKNL